MHCDFSQFIYVTGTDPNTTKVTNGHNVNRWKSLVPSPRYSGERVRVRGLQAVLRRHRTCLKICCDVSQFTYVTGTQPNTTKVTNGHNVDRWKSLVPSPRYSGERVRVRGLQSSVEATPHLFENLLRRFSIYLCHRNRTKHHKGDQWTQC